MGVISRVYLKDRNKAMDLILMLCLKDILDQIVMANSVLWYGHVLVMEYSHVF